MFRGCHFIPTGLFGVAEKLLLQKEVEDDGGGEGASADYGIVESRTGVDR